MLEIEISPEMVCLNSKVIYKEDALRKIKESFDRGTSKGYVCIPTGCGKNALVFDLVEQEIKQNKNNHVLVLFPDIRLLKIFEQDLESNHNSLSNNIIALTYDDIIKKIANSDLNPICTLSIVMECESNYSFDSIEKISEKIIGITNEVDLASENYFYESEKIYAYWESSFRYTEGWYIENLIIPILKDLGFLVHEKGKKECFDSKKAHIDIFAEKDNEQYAFEIKTYRSIINNQDVINNALNHAKFIKEMMHEKNINVCAILLCHIDNNIKKKFAEEEGIAVWDVENILYFCENSTNLKYLPGLFLPYPVQGLRSEKPLKFKSKQTTNQSEQKIIPDYSRLIKECKPGKEDAIKYEKLCADILDYLFNSEFSQFSKQHKTKDEMFRMDILCALKGTTAFWKMLMQYYNTRFIVFEFKNYTEKIQQNLIYVTDKYLFNPALRNVAFMISRKGFDEHAREAAIGILKEYNKLIIDLTDEDLVEMINMKSSGEEPSDYLLAKVEEMLMSVGI